MKTITTLTPQQVFDNAVAVAKTGIRSGETINGQFNCQYRSPDKSTCFIGASIPDNIYKNSFDYEYGGDIFEIKEWTAPLFDGIDADFLYKLQRIHDNNPSPEDDNKLNIMRVHRELGVFAEENNLSFDWEISP
jgi:hypothetical protein